jgi:hypothetical protein
LAIHGCVFSAAALLVILAGCAPSGAVTATPSPIPTVAPRIDSFITSASRVRPGDTITLSWKTNLDHVVVDMLDPMGWPDYTYTDMPRAGSLDWTVDPHALNPFQIWLRAGAQSQSLTVDIICPDDWFVANPPATCPQPATGGVGMVQRFEGGTMVWIGPIRQIVVLWAGDWPNYELYNDTWEPGMRKSNPRLIPPDGLYQPLRRFGRVWRRMGGPARFGWALAPEYSMPVRFQCDSSPRASICLLDGPDGVLKLGSVGGKFAPYTGP